MTIKCHLLLPDLLLPRDIVADASARLELPALERMLMRAERHSLASTTMESWLCDIFGVEGEAIAPVTLRADGIPPGTDYWLRADPVHIQMQRDQFIVQPQVHLIENEAAQMCAELNTHFAGEGLHFVAPHPQRWYVRLKVPPNLITYPLAQVASRNLRSFMPKEMMPCDGINYLTKFRCCFTNTLSMRRALHEESCQLTACGYGAGAKRWKNLRGHLPKSWGRVRWSKLSHKQPTFPGYLYPRGRQIALSLMRTMY